MTKLPFESIVINTRQDQLLYDALYCQWVAACQHADARYYLERGVTKAAAHHQDLARSYAQSAMDARTALDNAR